MTELESQLSISRAAMESAGSARPSSEKSRGDAVVQTRHQKGAPTHPSAVAEGDKPEIPPEARRPVSGSKPELADPEGGFDPNEAVEGLINEKRQVWFRHRVDQALERFDRYAETADLDEEVREEVEGLLEDTMLDISIVRQARHAGTMPDEQAFEEFEEIREDFVDQLDDVLGEDESNQLRETLTGPLSKQYY